MKEQISTVGFRSNLYPVVSSCLEDRTFRSKIHDPFSLVTLQKRAALTPLQKLEYQQASLHCAYAEPDDYPWGTIKAENGREQVV